MIIEFRVQNHRSFREEQTLSLVASNYDKGLAENLIPAVPGLPDTRLVKAAALYGPNAGGKTNVLLALEFLQWLVVESATGQKPEAKLPCEPFRLDAESAEAPTKLELAFVVEDIRYEFAVAVSPQRVVQERLVAYPNGRAQKWYDRAWNNDTKTYEWSQERADDFELDPGIKAKTRENALFLSTAAQWNNAQVAPVFQWFSTQLKVMNLSAGSPLSHEHTARMISTSGNAREFINILLRSADLGLKDVEVREEATDEVSKKFFESLSIPIESIPEGSWRVTFKHEGKGGQAFPVPWHDESHGTRRFFSMLAPWLTAINENQVLCVDELETSLHPSLAAELLRLLFKLTNTRSRAQLLFTTHNPLLLDTTLLRRDQIWFADKNQQGESFLYPLTDYKPRADESLVRGYLSGRYGAVPFIPEGLMPTNGETKPEEVASGS